MFKSFKFNFKYLNFLIQSKSNKNRKISNFISIYYVSFFFLFNFKDFNFENRIRKRRSRTRSINSDGRSPAGSSASELSSASPPGNQHPSLFVCECVCVCNCWFSQLGGGVVPVAEDHLVHGRRWPVIQILRPHQLQNADAHSRHHPIWNFVRYAHR